MRYLLLLCLFCGCSNYDDPEVKLRNKAMLSQGGEFIGELPDGRKVSRYYISMGNQSSAHWIYVTDGSITVNHEVRTGKTSHNEVQVLIDGIKYAPLEPQ